MGSFNLGIMKERMERLKKSNLKYGGPGHPIGYGASGWDKDGDYGEGNCGGIVLWMANQTGPILDTIKEIPYLGAERDLKIGDRIYQDKGRYEWGVESRLVQTGSGEWKESGLWGNISKESRFIESVFEYNGIEFPFYIRHTSGIMIEYLKKTKEINPSKKDPVQRGDLILRVHEAIPLNPKEIQIVTKGSDTGDIDEIEYLHVDISPGGLRSVPMSTLVDRCNMIPRGASWEKEYVAFRRPL
jgi:hypothetical protein